MSAVLDGPRRRLHDGGGLLPSDGRAFAEALAEAEAEVRKLKSERLNIRAELARRGLMDNQLTPWWSPDTDSDVVPKAQPDVIEDAFSFISWLQRKLSQ
jgi:hypothetical protein